MSAPAPRPVVTAFLRRPDGRVLLVRRGERVGTFRGRWSAISGYLEDADASPLARARQEVREETGIAPAALTLVAAGAPLLAETPDGTRRFRVHPFLFTLAADPEIALDWENTQAEWAAPGTLAARATVPRLADAYRACLDAAGEAAPGPDDAPAPTDADGTEPG